MVLSTGLDCEVAHFVISELCMSFSSAAICAGSFTIHHQLHHPLPKAYLWKNVAIMWTTKIAGMFSSHTASNNVTMTYMQI